MHTLDGDGSKTAKITQKCYINRNNIALLSMLLWLALHLYDLGGFLCVAVGSLPTVQSLTFRSYPKLM